ncbi:type 4b pilus protein PilO2 [Achromobacter xylosoxidans]|uniref:type 4b pilus protein PilO2 n=1 Tax=Alcaligenes xylosoxydans xylosoxydans TaxID=85698 RepID=UPI00047DD12C|nr:type 4b pilus protein PilO2 [Achromobacter xylosoxidans]
MGPNQPAAGSVTVISAGGKFLVSGLYWQTLSQPQKVMKEAREIGRRDGMDIVAIRRLPTIIQAGFVRKQAGVQKGMFSLASIVADLLLRKDGQSTLDPLIAAFAVGDGRFAIVAFKDGGVVPDSDVVFASLALAQEAIRALYALLSSKGKEVTVYAPAELEFGGDTSVTLESLARAASRTHKLKPLRFGLSRREWILLAAALVAIVVALVAYQIWREHQREREEQLERQRQAELARILKDSGQEVLPAALVHPWTTTPSVPAMISHCRAAARSTPLYLAAWELLGHNCTPNAYEAAYVRQPRATVLAFRAAAAVAFPPGSTVSIQADADQATVRVISQAPAGGDDEMRDVHFRVDHLVSHLQKQLIPIKVAPKAQQSQGTSENQVAMPLPDWSTATFEITSDWPAVSIFHGFDTRGVRLLEQSTTIKESKLSYTLKGEIYGN